MRKTVLLFGGNSDERLVSVASAQNMAGHFNFSEIWYIEKQGPVHVVTQDELLSHQRPFEYEFITQSQVISPSIFESAKLLKDKVVFLALHGTEGEDGELQTYFEKNRIYFTGTGAEASRAAFLKDTAKSIIRSTGIPLAKDLIIDSKHQQHNEKLLSEFFSSVGKFVLKPIASGSSIGLHIISQASDIGPVCSQIADSVYLSYLAEQFIEGRELTVTAYSSDGSMKSLPPSEIVLEKGHSFDYQGKYLGRGTTEITPADLTPKEIEQAQKIAIQAHLALGCYGYSRTDMILTPTGLIYLETNTLPGLSKASFVPQQLAVAKIEIKDFIHNQIGLAQDRYLGLPADFV